MCSRCRGQAANLWYVASCPVRGSRYGVVVVRVVNSRSADVVDEAHRGPGLHPAHVLGASQLRFLQTVAQPKLKHCLRSDSHAA